MTSSLGALAGPRGVFTWHPASALEALAGVIEREGRIPHKLELAAHGAPSVTTLRKLFGSKARAERLARELIDS